jgi:peroxin-6
MPEGLVSTQIMMKWLKLTFERTADQEDVLYIPLQLIPRYSNVPLRATLYHHQPVELSLVILQPISSTDNPSDVDVLEVQPLLSDLKPPMNGSLPKGHANGHLERPSSDELTILREGHSTSLTRKDSHIRSPLRILMLEPVAQGYATRSTRFILSDTPWDPNGDEEDSYMDSMADGASSHGRTTLSLADFDPDAFLSSSLALALQPSYGEDTDVDADMALSVSSTSGSITPRPPGTVVIPPPSPPARLKEMDNLDGMDENEVGTRFGAVRAMGPDSNRRNDDVCWVSVGGLGRAGIFEGDWVSLDIAVKVVI